MIKFFKSLFQRKPETKFAYKVDHPIEEMFTIDDIPHYQFKDISKIKCMRAFVVSDFYSELNMRCTKDYLIKHTEATEKLLSNSKQINITQIAQLNLQLKERLEMIYEVDIIYKIASVVFFDNTENPYEYDDIYAREKIERFKSYARTNDGFFFETLFKSLLNTDNLSDQDLETYLKVGELMKQTHLEVISTILSNTNETNGLVPASG